eukprot:6765971-Alexandrium_andersonii.AAC.1
MQLPKTWTSVGMERARLRQVSRSRAVGPIPNVAPAEHEDGGCAHWKSEPMRFRKMRRQRT